MFNVNVTFLYESVTFILLVFGIRYFLRRIGTDLEKRRQYVNNNLKQQEACQERIIDLKKDIHFETLKAKKNKLQAQEDLERLYQDESAKAELALANKLEAIRSKKLKDISLELDQKIAAKHHEIAALVVQTVLEIKQVAGQADDPETIQRIKNKLKNASTIQTDS